MVKTRAAERQFHSIENQIRKSESAAPPATTTTVALQRSLPPDEPRKSGTCYFCKKAFMKNKQLMNHVCPKKPKQLGGGGSDSGN